MPLFRPAAASFLAVASLWISVLAHPLRAGVPDFGSWLVEGAASVDAGSPGPDGRPSISVGPRARVSIPLRKEDGSGRLVVHVEDDGFAGRPDGARANGPRWGLRQADGRVLVAGVMHARYLHAEGSLCLIDTMPDARDAWNAVRFVSPRKPGWSKWEFRYDPEGGLAVLIDDQPVSARYFDWNSTRATGFNAIVFFGDESPDGRPFRAGGLECELGGPMKVRPDPEAALRAAREAALASAKKKPAGPAAPREKWTGGFPGPTLADDLDLPSPPLVAGYASARPRLLFSAADREALRRKAGENPALWRAVLANAARVADPAGTPTPEDVMHGKAYWRVEGVQSAALAWFVTGEAGYRDGAIRWLVAHCREPVWGTGFRPNLDLQASWYLYHLAIAYDLLRGELTDADAAAVRAGLAAHARALFDDFDPATRTEAIHYDQNHTYIPTVALLAGSLALLGEEPAADGWLALARAVLRRCRHVLNEDGYYYEGVGYWAYALHWHVRGAELLGRATGENLMDLPALRENWRFALHLSLPGRPWAFDAGDTGLWSADHRRPDIRVNNGSMLWAVAKANGSRESRAAGDFLAARVPERDYPASAFLWFDAGDAPRDLAEIEPYHHFKDQDVVAWRSGWGADATALLFRCGPPLGHAAAAKLGRLRDWTMNTGHAHADIGAFYLYAKGAYLAVGTGYTAEKWTRDQNTLLVDGKGQAADGDYHNGRGVPYGQLDGAGLDRVYLSKDYGYASGVLGSAYERQAKNVDLRRGLLATARWTLTVDDLRARDGEARRLTWLCHADAPFEAGGAGAGLAHVARLPRAGLAVLTLAPSADALEARTDETVVAAGMAPGKGRPARHGYQLALTNREPAAGIRLVNLLVPLGAGEAPPVVEGPDQEEGGRTLAFGLAWPDGKRESVRLDLGWTADGRNESGPARIVAR